MTSSGLNSFDESDGFRFLLPQDVGNTEEVEDYKPGGFHPVHLGDRYDDGRYTIVNKLGAGGYATVWLARDEQSQKWVALKITKADIYEQYMSRMSHRTHTEGHSDHFDINGPNGRHLGLVLPVLGPSISALSYNFESRLTPKAARRAAFEATKSVHEFHQRGWTHGGKYAQSSVQSSLTHTRTRCHHRKSLVRYHGP